MKKRYFLIPIIVLLIAIPIYLIASRNNQIKDMMTVHKETTNARAIYFIDFTSAPYVVYQDFNDVLYKLPKDIPPFDADINFILGVIKRTNKCQPGFEENVYTHICPVEVENEVVGAMGAYYGNETKHKTLENRLSLERLSRAVGFLY